MAWQLIYTSAPRLLEAGRTGFGTVARHRSVGGLLTAAVERSSQFARLPGHDPRRVVHAHRIITAGPSAYHVFTCLQDAGSDYTGRTNHIAHHVIAEAQEVRGLAAAGITPADVLLAMPWRGAWTEGARFLDETEEVDLAGLRTERTDAWAQMTGNARHAALLTTPEARKGCYLITPDGAPVLELFRESLEPLGEAAWQMTFTTSLEPNDEVADFRWIAVAELSPLRPQAEGSARPVLNLADPGSLPPPPEIETTIPQVPRLPGAAPSSAAPSPAGRDMLSAGASMPDNEPVLPAAAGRPPIPSSMAPEMPAAGHAALGSWLPESRGRARSGKRSILPWVLMASVLVLGCASALVWYLVMTNQREAESTQLAQEIEAVWQKHALKLPQTKAMLLGKAALPEKADRDATRQLVHGYEAEFRKLARLLEVPSAAAGGIESPDGNHEDDLADLDQALEQWVAAGSMAALADDWSARTSPALMASAWDTWQEKRQKAWAKCQAHFVTAKACPVDEAGMRSLRAKLLEILNGTAQPAGSSQDWQDFLRRIQGGAGDDGAAVPGWLAAWKKLEDLGPGADARHVEGVTAEVAAAPGVPAWLKSLAARKGREAKSLAETVEKQPMPAPVEAKPEVKVEDVANRFEASHPIYLCFLQGDEEKLVLEIPVLAQNPEPQIYFGGFFHLDSWRMFEPGHYRQKEMVLKPFIKIKGIQMELTVPPQGGRLVACTAAKKVLCDVRLITPGASTAELLRFAAADPKFTVTTSPGGQQTVEIGAFIKRLKFLGRTEASVYHLVSTDGKKLHFELVPVDARTSEAVPFMPQVPRSFKEAERNSLRAMIDNLLKDIKNVEEEIQGKENSNTAKIQKEKDLKSLRDSKAAKEARLAEALQKLAQLDAKTTPNRLASGKYFLQARFSANDDPPAKDVCLIEIVVPGDAPPPAPAPPPKAAASAPPPSAVEAAPPAPAPKSQL